MSARVDAGVDAFFNVSLPEHPYPGLRPFRESEWMIYFGRERIVEHVIGELVEKRFVSIHGDSGSGKSSLVRAGVLPRLIQDLGRGGATWRTASMEPGNAPMRNLAAAFADLDADDHGEDAVTRMRRTLNLGREAAPTLVRELRRDDTDHLCVLVDQFEELFAFARDHDRAEAELFLEVLIGIQQQRLDGLHVILTMRSEYLGACARFDGLAQTINDTQYLLPPVSRQALLRAIREPALLYGGRVTIDLAERLIADAGAGQDQLPLVQHCLMIMQRRLSTALSTERVEGDVDDRPNWTLSLDDYRRTNGVVELLSDHADDVLRRIETHHGDVEPIMEGVFRALTDIDADGHAIRRRQTLGQLADNVGVDATKLAALLGPLRADGVSFLRPYGDQPLAKGDEISVSHEALIRCWRRIADPARGWLQREFEDGLIWKTLLVAADGFAADKKAVLSPAVTTERARWLAGKNAAWAQRYGGRFEGVRQLLRASEREVGRQRRLRGLLGLTFLGAAVLGVYLIWSKAETDRQLAVARAEREVAEAELQAQAAEIQAELYEFQLNNAKDENLELRSQLLAQASAEATAAGDAGSGLALALEVLQIDLPYVPEAERGAYAALFELRERIVLDPHDSSLSSAKFFPNGTQLVTGSLNGIARVRDATSGETIALLRGHESPIWSVAVSPDGARVATGSDYGVARLWRATDGETISTLTGHEDAVWSVAFSPDGTHLATGSRDGTVRVWNTTSGEMIVMLDEPVLGTGTVAAFSPDGTRLAIGSQSGTARVWDIRSGETIVDRAHDAPVNGIAFGPDGTSVVTGSADGSAWLWDAASGETIATLTGHESPIWSVAVSPDGTRVAAGFSDGTARVWDPMSGETTAVLGGHQSLVNEIAFDPTGTRLVTASGDGTARIWSVDTALSARQVGSSRSERERNGDAEVSNAPNTFRSSRGALVVKSDAFALESVGSIGISPSGDRVVRSTGFGSYGQWHPAPHGDGTRVVDRPLGLDEPIVIATGFAGEQDVAIVASRLQPWPFEFLIEGRRHVTPSETAATPDAAAFAPTRNRAAVFYAGPPGFVELYDLSEAPELIGRFRISEPERTGSTGYLLAFQPDGESVVGLSESGDSLFAIDWQPAPSGQSRDTAWNQVIDVAARVLQPAIELDSILALHADRGSVVVVAVPRTRALDTVVVGDLLDDDGTWQTVRPGPNERRPTSAAIGPDGKRVALASQQAVNLYSRDKGGVIARFASSGGQIAAATLAADGTALAAAYDDGSIAYWPIFPTTGLLRSFAEDVAPRQLTPEQIQTHLSPPQSTK